MRKCLEIIILFGLIFAIFGSLSSVQGSEALARKMIYYQGLLLDAESVPLGGDGTEFCFKFSIYDDEEVGEPDKKFWPADDPPGRTIVIKKGFFNVIVGDPDWDAPLDLPPGANLFLQMQVAEKVGENCAGRDEEYETLEPRQAIFWPDSLIPPPSFSAANIACGGLCLERDGRIYLPEGENQIVGRGLIPVNTSEAFIFNNSIESTSLIFVSPTSYLSSPLYIKEKKSGEGFVVATAFPAAAEITFDWLVLETSVNSASTTNNSTIRQSDNGNIDPALLGQDQKSGIDGGDGPAIDGGANNRESEIEDAEVLTVEDVSVEEETFPEGLNLESSKSEETSSSEEQILEQ